MNQQCVVCGATLKPEAEWCGQCYAPRSTAHPNHPSFRQAPASGYQDPRLRDRPEAVETTFSRFRAGPTSMGVFGRSLVTLLTLVAAVFAYFYVFPATLGISGPPEELGFAIAAVPVLFLVLKRVWRPTRIS
ncbi:MAG TPA: hypothetical protein VID47_02410 [Actinomycetota bacterium]|jgi:hypothetical protein